MVSVKVIWFNVLKNFGEGITEDGKKIFLHGAALMNSDDAFPLNEGKKIFCDLRTEDGQLYAYRIDTIGQPALFPKTEKVKSPISPEISD